MGKVGAIITIIFLSWIVYSAYFILNFHPEISGEWGAVKGDNIELLLNVDLSNPSPAPILLETIKVKLAGVKIGETKRANIAIFSRKVTIDSIINLDNLTTALINHIKEKEESTVSVYAKLELFDVIPVEYSRDVNFQTDLLSYLKNLRVEPKIYSIGGIPLKTPGIEGMDAKWGRVSNDSIEIIGWLKLYNPNSFPIPVTGLSADLYMNSVNIGKGVILKGTVLQPNSRGEVKVKLVLDVDNFKEAFKTHITNGERSTIRADINLVVKVGGVEYEIPIKDIETTFETDILGSIKFG